MSAPEGAHRPSGAERGSRSVRIAAVGDIHLGTDSQGWLRPDLEDLPDRADVLLLAGDLTHRGSLEEARVVAGELHDLGLPVVAVLGNHDHHSDQTEQVVGILEDAGVTVLEGTSTQITTADGTCLGIAGAKGFGGGFQGACASDFGEPEMKAFIGHTRRTAERLGSALGDLATDHRVVLLHYAPVDDTLRGERLEIYPFLGSYLLAEAIDAHGADLVLHGHAHGGVERGITPLGVRVRNVAQPVLRAAVRIYTLGADDASGVPGGDHELALADGEPVAPRR